MLLTGIYDFNNPSNRVGQLKAHPVIIGEGACPGLSCIILPGVAIGEGAVVGAGAVVVNEVLAQTLVAGVPTVFIRELLREE
jgi:acetyltransferase-like isoleucine patch superfamily enzyme